VQSKSDFDPIRTVGWPLKPCSIVITDQAFDAPMLKPSWSGYENIQSRVDFLKWFHKINSSLNKGINVVSQF
jgi:hypothetical protein